MNKCKLEFGFDVGACLHDLALGWIPTWVWEYAWLWPWAAAIVGAGLAYRLAGAPGLAAFAAAVGFILGRRSVPTSEQYPHPDEKPAPKPKKGLWKK
jgi:hypothetical protein